MVSGLPIWEDPAERELYNHGWVDVDGVDGPDLVDDRGSEPVAGVLQLGGMEFAPFEVLWAEDNWPKTCIHTLDWGDVDGDQDIDFFLPGLDESMWCGQLD